MMARTWGKFSGEKREGLRKSAEDFLGKL